MNIAWALSRLNVIQNGKPSFGTSNVRIIISLDSNESVPDKCDYL